MKKRNLVIALAVTTIAIGFTACKKVTGAGDATTASISSQSAIADNLTEDANNIFTQTASDSTALLGAARPAPYYNATVTITPGVGFPKTITIDFGTGTTSEDGVFRTGKIIAVLSDSFRLNGTTVALSFNNYTVDGYGKTGTINWTNLSHGDTLQWTRVDSGTVFAPTGKYWHHSGTRSVVQTAGFGDDDLFDNVYSITGNHTYLNSDGISSSAITVDGEPLEKKANCYFIDKGQIKITGPNHYAIIDFGNGDCDNLATYSVDGGTSYGFKLW